MNEAIITSVLNLLFKLFNLKAVLFIINMCFNSELHRRVIKNYLLVKGITCSATVGR